MVTCHGTKKRHGNTAKSHTNVMVFRYRRERRNSRSLARSPEDCLDRSSSKGRRVNRVSRMRKREDGNDSCAEPEEEEHLRDFQ